MKILKLDLYKLSDWLVDLIEHYVFEDSQHQSFRISEKEAIKTVVRMQLQNLREKYDIVELDLKEKK